MVEITPEMEQVARAYMRETRSYKSCASFSQYMVHLRAAENNFRRLSIEIGSVCDVSYILAELGENILLPEDDDDDDD